MRLRAPAKINLFLRITGKRSDGYHELFSLMCPVSLFDEIFLHFGANQISVSCHGADIPEDETNIAWRSAKRFFETIGMGGGVSLFINKNIPVAAGLGGGSSDAAAVLSGLNQYYGSPLSHEQLMEIAGSIGADIPFFLSGRPAIVKGIGDILEPFCGIKPYCVVLVYPGFGLSTREVFKKLNFKLTNRKKNHKNNSFNNREFKVPEDIINDLEIVSTSLYPDIMDAKNWLLITGAVGAAMSGSGSSVFGLFADSESAKNACRIIKREHPNWQLYAVDLIL